DASIAKFSFIKTKQGWNLIKRDSRQHRVIGILHPHGKTGSRLNQIISIQTNHGQHFMKGYTLPSTFPDFSTETIPPTHHVEMSSVSHPILQQSKTIRKSYI